MGVKINNDTILLKLTYNIKNIPKNEALMTECHNLLAKYLEPYIPMDEGNLSHNVNITPEAVSYVSPYAHYQYEGVVYGPNIPIYENGVIVGWWSKPNKHPTGASLQYSTEKHPLATHHWETAMMKDKSSEFKSDIKDKILQEINKEGG